MKRILKKFTLVFVLILFFISSCKNNKEVKSFNSNITQVTVGLPGVGCESECPFEAVKINNDLSLFYFGGAYAKKKGYFKGKVTQEIWDSVMIKFNKFLTKGIDTTGHRKTDHPEVEFIIYEGQKKNDFIINTGSLSDRDMKTLYWFTRKVVEMTNLTPSDSINFGLNPSVSPPLPATKIQ